ncbi:phosphate ABC transporter substrate-binding prot ein [Desulfonema ishimotonii]|uniref:Phosphate ABC transporter substrate-binding prot ein n=1 Tax=Desulfonema ishimotonii TaxID=45657 RepID=A0A401FST3_9BACT|nr:substrate-binding domain-containing protein [Desulfonema ishimotonii]GBC60029.1 phosphate ABC transporter substrate-binding prot ein [Desulfonema ishimotonii]
MKKFACTLMFWIWAMTGFAGLASQSAVAGETLKYSCSAQIFEAFEMDRIDTFTADTGIGVTLFKSSSKSAVNRLMNGYSDIASTTRRLHYISKESGYAEIPFCKDNLAIITGRQVPVENISSDRLREIFSKKLTNWQEIGGPDKPIKVVVPGKNTAAYQNFKDGVMHREKIRYDFISTQSSDVIDAVRRFSGAISFITYGGVAHNKEIRTVGIDGISPQAEAYPYPQTFYFVVKGQPTGSVKAFVDFAFSEKGRKIIREKGMIPIDR